jgi:hypothetical protein
VSIAEETYEELWPITAVKVKGKVHHRTDHEALKGSGFIALLFL